MKRRILRILTVAFAFLLTLVLFACGGDGKKKETFKLTLTGPVEVVEPLSLNKDKVEKDTNVTVKVNVTEGKEVKVFTVGGADKKGSLSQDNKFTFKVTKDTAVVAELKDKEASTIETYKLTLNPAENLVVQIPTEIDLNAVEKDTQVIILITAPEGNELSALTVKQGETDVAFNHNEKDNLVSFTVTGNTTVEATFEEVIAVPENEMLIRVFAPEGTKNVYIVGSFQTPAWQIGDAVQFTRVGETNEFRHFLSIEGLEITSLEFKLTCAKNWDNQEEPEYQHEFTELPKNRIYKYTVPAWKSMPIETVITKTTQKFKVTVPAGTEKVYMAGSFANPSFALDQAVELTKVEGLENVFETELTLPEGLTLPLTFKFLCDKNWTYAEVLGDNRSIGAEINELEVYEGEVTAWEEVPAVTEEFFALTFDDTIFGIVTADIDKTKVKKGTTVLFRILQEEPAHLLVTGLYINTTEVMEDINYWVEDTENPGEYLLKVVVNEATEIKFTFVDAVNITVQTSATNVGHIEVLGEAKVAKGSEVTVQVIEGYGYEVETFTAAGEDKLTELIANAELKYTFTANADTHFIATFKPITYSLTLNFNAEQGNVEVQPTGLTLTAVPHNQVIKLVVSALTGFEVESLAVTGKVNPELTGGEYEFQITENTVVDVTFKPTTSTTHKITILGTNASQITLKSGATSLDAVEDGATVVLHVDLGAFSSMNEILIDGVSNWDGWDINTQTITLTNVTADMTVEVQMSN